jgi:hypothetical protein
MKKVIALILITALLFCGCSKATSVDSQPSSSASSSSATETSDSSVSESTAETTEADNGYRDLSDPDLLDYIEDTAYEELVSKIDNDKYAVQNVEAIYISEEYLEELEYNSKQNIFFGYTLDEVDAQFKGERYVFTLGDEGETVVKPFESYDETTEKIIRNVAIGTGVILVCVVITVATEGAGAPAACAIFACAAKGAAIGSISGAAIGGLSAGILTGIQTHDKDAALKAAALQGSEGFKWGAITGAISGGVTEAAGLYGATLAPNSTLTMNDVALIQKETKYPLDVIKQFHSMEEYNVFKAANLKSALVNGKTALVQQIPMTEENIALMKAGKAPLDANGVPFELHHVGQTNDSTLAILTQDQHRGKGTFKILHDWFGESRIDRKLFDSVTRPEFWKAYATTFAT